MFDGTTINLGVAFLAGLLSFLATCLIPVVPSYLAFLAGVDRPVDHAPRQRLFRAALGFVVGFIGIFVLLGLTVNTFARDLGPYRALIRWAGGIWLIVFGLLLTGWMRIPWAEKTIRLDVSRFGRRGSMISGLATGAAFGFSWTPCIGPVLAVALFYASQAGTAAQGAGLLLAYGVGLAIPFLLASLALRPIMDFLRKNMRWWALLPHLAGTIVVVSGLLMLSGHLQALSQFFARWMSTWSVL